MKRFLISLFVISLLGICQTLTYSQNVIYDYYGQVPPGDNPIVFAPGIVSVDKKNSHALVVSPDGKTIIFSRYPDGTSYILSKTNDTWTGPVESFFYGKEVSFYPDGNKIFYYTGGDIFYVEKNSTGWKQPVNLGSNINTSSQVEYYPSIVQSGDLYFSRDGNWATGRLMYSKFQNGEYQNAVDLGLPINNGGALHAWVSPDESYILFNSPRVGSYTQNDIWISFRKNNKWSEPRNLGKKINSGADAVICPTVSPDGKYMFITRLNFRTNTGYIYWVSTKIMDSLKAAENTTGIKPKNSSLLIKNFDLKQNYPNPFNPVTTIKYSIPVKTRDASSLQIVTLKVIDLLGREISTLVNETKSPGNYEVKFNAGHTSTSSSMPSGIYFYRLQASSYSETKKFILMK